ncbi:NADP-dependent phosphogluconate dehydrogenase [Ramlibacter albus]|uniref:6-phosphogluconate dehydrogenase, decarboxylating n=1 Tax=Ramlibacter albus TaxID=2079448 RepID=A0A923S4B0_9BURK|nr:NADP-dependent phosphogluconate dehydrogenase [Ramlibacter albus]MBC5767286.1 NADP-dependent phosphogluconate dehydrogenase [Ramlibacter albus]
MAFDLGVIGLGVMGANLARNFVDKGFSVAGFDVEAAKRERFLQAAASGRASAPPTMQAFVASLAAPRVVLAMVPAGAAVDAVIDSLRPLLEPGDIVVDGGNTRYGDTQARMLALEGTGLLYVGMGVSGGEEGALRGPALMPGGDERAWPRLKPLLQAVAARAGDGQPCCEWMGTGGAGHFVKMVHNGIEYADMQVIGEAYWLMRELLRMTPADIGRTFAQWNEGELESYLVAITADILSRIDPESGRPLVEVILDTAEQKGTGKWASQAALDFGLTAPTIAEAVFARTVSAAKEERVVAADVLKGPGGAFDGDPATLIEKIRRSLLAVKVCAYAQGFQLLQAGDREHVWNLPLAGIATIWRAGCIIRARLLEDIRSAYARDGELVNLMLDARFAATLAACQEDLRDVVGLAARHGVPAPAFMSALAYYDAYRSPQLPANLLQAQRDYFGSHLYQRVDRPGKFHTQWGLRSTS